MNFFNNNSWRKTIFWIPPRDAPRINCAASKFSTNEAHRRIEKNRAAIQVHKRHVGAIWDPYRSFFLAHIFVNLGARGAAGSAARKNGCILPSRSRQCDELTGAELCYHDKSYSKISRETSERFVWFGTFLLPSRPGARVTSRILYFPEKITSSGCLKAPHPVRMVP